MGLAISMSATLVLGFFEPLRVFWALHVVLDVLFPRLLALLIQLKAWPRALAKVRYLPARPMVAEPRCCAARQLATPIDTERVRQQLARPTRLARSASPRPAVIPPMDAPSARCNRLERRRRGRARRAEAALRDAQQALGPHPSLAYAGFLHDAEMEYAERC